MDKQKPVKISILITNIFFCILIIFTIILPYFVTWYVEVKGRSSSLATTIFVTCYPCVPFAGTILLSLRRFLKDILKGELFTPKSINYLRKICVCCCIISVITFISGKFYLPFLIVGATFAFLALLVFSFKSVLSCYEQPKNQDN